MKGDSTKSISSFLSLAATLSLLFGIHFESCNGSRLLAQGPVSMQFIRTSCSKTTYPALCFNSLSSYASAIQTSPIQLAHTALSITLDSARSTSTTMKTMSKSGVMSPQVAEAMSDCMDNVRDSVSELKQSMEAMGHLGGKDLGFQLNSIQTWASAALTDDNTCMDGFSGKAMNGEVKTAVRNHMVNVAQLTSNALVFINSLAAAYSSP